MNRPTGLVAAVIAAIGISACVKTVEYATVPDRGNAIPPQEYTVSEMCGYKVVQGTYEFSSRQPDTTYTFVNYPSPGYALFMHDVLTDGRVEEVCVRRQDGAMTERFYGTEKHDAVVAAFKSGNCQTFYTALESLMR